MHCRVRQTQVGFEGDKFESRSLMTRPPFVCFVHLSGFSSLILPSRVPRNSLIRWAISSPVSLAELEPPKLFSSPYHTNS